MKDYSLQDRAFFYNSGKFSKWPASRVHITNNNGKMWLSACWVLGNDFRNKSIEFFQNLSSTNQLNVSFVSIKHDTILLMQLLM